MGGLSIDAGQYLKHDLENHVCMHISIYIYFYMYKYIICINI